MRFSSTNHTAAAPDRKKILFTFLWALVFLTALYLRISGLFRGLDDPAVFFHPDEPKQVHALYNFLSGIYVRYYGSLFYDGYPYGLNHLDEYLLRPLFFFLGIDNPQPHPLYYYARLLRAAYGLITVVIMYILVARLVSNRNIALLAMFLLAIAPLSITVTHSATGDAGLDLFTALCLLFLVLYVDRKEKKWWIFAAGTAIGSAFAAKYNGLLIGIVPAMLLFSEFSGHRDLKLFFRRCLLLLSGIVAGTVLFTPNLLLDSSTTLKNILANFQFIKNYKVPAEILAMPWLDRVFLGFQNNAFPILSSLGFLACLGTILALVSAARIFFACRRFQHKTGCEYIGLILAVTIFPILTFIISLSGKLVVQPFHFSFLAIPLIIASCYFISILNSSRSILPMIGGLLFIIMLVLEFGRVSLRENFFWRLEDNAFFEQNLPSSVYTQQALYSYPGGKIRSLYLEPPGNSVFRNRSQAAEGPDWEFWNAIEVTPLPHVSNPIGEDWIFINGPTFPRNDKTINIRAMNFGMTVKRYLVMPAGSDWPALGFRSGSYATKALINFGNARAKIELEAHQQKILRLVPEKWKSSGNPKQKVLIIPLSITVPHNDVWLTILSTQKEEELFNLFGGGQDHPPSVPEKMPAGMEQQFFNAMDHIRYLETHKSRRITAGKRVPAWEVALPAGIYRLTWEIDGLADASEIIFEFEDAKEGGTRQLMKSLRIGKGLQRVEYSFIKPFAPYQGRIIVSTITGDIRIHACTILPDSRMIFEDFTSWRGSGTKPEWVSRF